MNIFQRPEYRSETSEFLDSLKAQNPRLPSEQRQGRERLWDVSINPELNEEFNAARVAQAPYVYQTKAHA